MPSWCSIIFWASLKKDWRKSSCILLNFGSKNKGYYGTWRHCDSCNCSFKGGQFLWQKWSFPQTTITCEDHHCKATQKLLLVGWKWWNGVCGLQNHSATASYLTPSGHSTFNFQIISTLFPFLYYIQAFESGSHPRFLVCKFQHLKR